MESVLQIGKQTAQLLWDEIPEGNKEELAKGRLNTTALAVGGVVGLAAWVLHRYPLIKGPQSALDFQRALPFLASYGGALFVTSLINRYFLTPGDLKATDSVCIANKGIFLAMFLCFTKNYLTLQGFKRFVQFLTHYKKPLLGVGTLLALGSLAYWKYLRQPPTLKELKAQLKAAIEATHGPARQKLLLITDEVLALERNVEENQTHLKIWEIKQEILQKKLKILEEKKEDSKKDRALITSELDGLEKEKFSEIGYPEDRLSFNDRKDEMQNIQARCSKRELLARIEALKELLEWWHIPVAEQDIPKASVDDLVKDLNTPLSRCRSPNAKSEVEQEIQETQAEGTQLKEALQKAKQTLNQKAPQAYLNACQECERANQRVQEAQKRYDAAQEKQEKKKS